MMRLQEHGVDGRGRPCSPEAAVEAESPRLMTVESSNQFNQINHHKTPNQLNRSTLSTTAESCNPSKTPKQLNQLNQS